MIGRQRRTVLLANWMASVSDIKPVASVSAAVHFMVAGDGEDEMYERGMQREASKIPSRI